MGKSQVGQGRQPASTICRGHRENRPDSRLPNRGRGRVTRPGAPGWGPDSTVARIIMRLTLRRKPIAPPGSAKLGHPTDCAEDSFGGRSRARRNCQTRPDVRATSLCARRMVPAKQKRVFRSRQTNPCIPRCPYRDQPRQGAAGS